MKHAPLSKALCFALVTAALPLTCEAKAERVNQTHTAPARGDRVDVNEGRQKQIDSLIQIYHYLVSADSAYVDQIKSTTDPVVREKMESFLKSARENMRLIRQRVQEETGNNPSKNPDVRGFFRQLKSKLSKVADNAQKLETLSEFEQRLSEKCHDLLVSSKYWTKSNARALEVVEHQSEERGSKLHRMAQQVAA
jgi:response regulator RpfG family c-di-GMP phosphodiesterase